MEKPLLRQHECFRLGGLTPLVPQKFRTHDGVICYSGTSLIRDTRGYAGLLNHYGMVYRKINGVIYVIENNEFGVEVISIEDFSRGLPVNTDRLVKSFEESEIVLSRALKVSNRKYNERYWNCEQFVNESLFGETTSNQVDFIEGVVNLAISFGEIVLLSNSNTQDPFFLDETTKLRRLAKIPRVPELDAIISKHQKRLRSRQTRKK